MPEETYKKRLKPLAPRTIGSASRGFSSRLIAASCILVVGQALVLASLGHRTPGPVLSEAIQLVLGLICILACTSAFRRSSGIARYAWRLLAVTFVVWAVAQVLGVYLDISGDHSLESLDEILFFLSVIPFGLIAFLDPDSEPNHFDRLHIFDFTQVCIFWVSIFLCFSPRMWSAATAFRIGHFTWSRNISFDGVLVVTFVLRALLTKSKAVRWLFGRMALFLLLSGLADSYALSPGQDLQPGGWFDLIWSALLGFPILIAATWKNEKEGQTDGSPKTQSIVVSQIFPLVYPMINFFVLARVNRAYPILSTILFALAFIAFAVRVVVIQRRQRESEYKYRVLFEESADATWLMDEKGFLDCNSAALQMFGYSAGTQMTHPADISPPNQPDGTPSRVAAEQKMATAFLNGKERFEWLHQRKNGNVFPAEVCLTALTLTGRRTLLATVRDITDRRVAEEHVKYLAYHDALTGLPNRALLEDRLIKALAVARRQKHKVALLFLDLDGFKNINDSLGHSVGDFLLQEIAERLKRWAREEDTVARLGGDEFVIMLTQVKGSPDAAVAAERLMDAMTAEFVVQDRPLSISCSVGISIFPEHGVDFEALIRSADAAMYGAKESGRNNYRFFTADMNAQAAERLILENSLRLALDKGELFLVYQPQIDISNGRITGLEALLRWQHPDLGLVPPDKFIQIAENSALILPIGEWVLRTACSQGRKWQEQGLPAVTVAVNVSPVQFRREGFCELIRRVLHETGLAPQYLELELTESLLLTNAEVMVSVVEELKAMGVTLAIDDFGTGYSNFTSLRRFGVSKLKIDRSFIRDVATNPDDAAITVAIISMAKSLRLKVIAEGVENEGQMSFLRSHQCDGIQGYYFSKPLAPEQAADKLRSNAVHTLSTSQGIGLALLVSADQVAIQQLSHALQQSSISPDVCQEVPAAIRLLNYRKFDAVIVDLQLGKQSGMVLGEVRLSPSNRTAVTFTISGSDAECTAFRKESEFVFERPLSAKSIEGTLKPAFGLILRERRRYFRCPLSIPVSVRRSTMPDVRCCCVNISEGGMAVSTSVALSPGEDVQVQFTLPGHKEPFLAESKICWSKTGHLGVRFVSFSQGHKSELQGWLSRKLEETLPELVAGKLRKAEGCSAPISKK
jgi:diguanylate cyclase (GGDEF)-like protein/PAS domain S-box-containing protein